MIFVDSIFSPIVKVNYYVEKLQSGVKEDLERLTIEVSTDGTIMPDDAISYASKLLIDHVKPFTVLQSTDIVEPERQIDEDKIRIRRQLERSIDELELSVRSYNCLQAAQIKNIADLVSKDENDMLRFKNFGRKSLNELVSKLDELGLRFGMDITEYVKDTTKK
jgi:DNA-directed RNA polymerase subunit alpha